MSDTEVAASPGAGPTDGAQQTQQQPAVPDPFDAGVNTFDRGYVTKLRDEAAANRVKAREAEERAARFADFDGLDDNDRAAMAEFVKAYKADPAAAGAIAKQWADALTPAERGDIAEAAGAAPDDAPMTRAEFAKAMAEHDAQLQQQAGLAEATRQLQAEAKQLGYDPDGDDYALLISVMNRLGTTDMNAAHAEVQKFFQAKIDGYVAQKANDADTTARTPTAGTAPVPPATPIRTFEDARKGAAEFLASLGS